MLVTRNFSVNKLMFIFIERSFLYKQSIVKLYFPLAMYLGGACCAKFLDFESGGGLWRGAEGGVGIYGM